MEGGRAQRELRILAFAHLHLDHALPWATRATGIATRTAQQVAFDAICATAATEADVLISAGDLYDHDRHHPETGELLRAGFERLAPMPVLLIPGGSDPLNGLSLYEQVKWSANVHLLRPERSDAPERSEPSEQPDLPAFLSPLPGLTVWVAADAAALAPAAAGAASSERDFNLAVLTGPAAPDQPPSGIQHVIAPTSHHPSFSAGATCPGAAFPVDPEDPPGGVLVLNVFEDGSLAVTRREIGASAPPRPARRFTTDELAGDDLAAIGEEQTVRGEFVRNLLTPEEAPVHLRRLALLAGLKALTGAAPLPGPEPEPDP